MEVKQVVKDYWPYLIGGAVGIYLIYQYSGSSSSSPVVVGQQFDQAAAAYGLQMRALDNQNASAQAAAAVAMAEVQRGVAADTLAASVAYTAAQGTAAKDVAAGSAQVIAQLQAPTVSAMQLQTAENIAALQTAGAIAAAGYGAQTAQAQAMGQAAAAAMASNAAQSLALSSTTAAGLQSIAPQQGALQLGQQASAAAQSSGATAGAAATAIGAIASMFSDATLKINIVECDESECALDKINQIDFVSFDYDPSIAESMESAHYNIGVLAQQLQEVDPTLVRDERGKLALNVGPLLMLALKGIQELARG